MDIEDPPDALDTMGMEGICSDTNAGWLWYCDEHETHGNADSEAEAEAVSEAHQNHIAEALLTYAMEDDPEAEDDGERCRVIIWQRVPHERTAG